MRVVNFVAQGTIEHGMLDVLRFKKSLFAGILDGGEKEVFLGGSRLNKFMEQVEKATTAIPEEMLEDAEEALRRPPMESDEDEETGETGQRPSGRPSPRSTPLPIPAGAPQKTADGPPAPTVGDPWSGLLQVGMALLQQLAGANGAGTGNGQGTKAGSAVVRDERTGETYLKVPLPQPEVLEGVLKSVGALLESLRGRQ